MGLCELCHLSLFFMTFSLNLADDKSNLVLVHKKCIIKYLTFISSAPYMAYFGAVTWIPYFYY